jgi:hypothetical protein
VASGRPAPRYASVGVLFVNTSVSVARIAGMLYVAFAISIVSVGMAAVSSML